MVGDDDQISEIHVDSNLLNSVLLSNNTAQLQVNLSSFPSNSAVQFQVPLWYYRIKVY